jgi:hypothetical protein
MSTNTAQPKNSRDDAIARIRAALKRRTGRPWSVRGGRGTAWSWIEVSAPPARSDEFGRISIEDANTLARIFGLPANHFLGGCWSISREEREHMVARAEGLGVEDLDRPLAVNDNADMLG